MARWAVKPRILTVCLKERRVAATFFRRASSTLRSNFFNRQTYEQLVCNGCSVRKHGDVCLPFRRFPFYTTTSVAFLCCSSFSADDFQSFNKMPEKEQGFGFTLFKWVLDLIRFRIGKSNRFDAMMIHSLVLKIGSLSHLPTSTSLLILYSNAGDLGSSLALFDEMVYKDVVVWNAIMTACSENKCHEASLNIFVNMVNEGHGFDSSSLLIVVSSLSRMNQMVPGQILHGLSLKTGVLLDCYLSNALINMYAKCGSLRSSEYIFQEMEYIDLVSWNSMISGCLHNYNPEKCVFYFRKMTNCAEVGDHITLSCAIAACTCIEDLDTGQAIHGLAIKLGYEESSHISVANSIVSLYSQLGDSNAAGTVFRAMAVKDVISWNAMIGGLASNGNFSEALEHVRLMQLAASTRPDTVTVITLISLIAELGLSREAKAIHGFSTRREMKSDSYLMNSLLDLYWKCNSIREAENLFRTMSQRDMVTWNTIICGYSQNGHSIKAQSLFKELLLFCKDCSLSTLLAILPSCDSPVYLQLGKSIHSWHIKSGFLNNIIAINSLMFMYINCGDLKSSFSLFWVNVMVADTTCWNTIIVGCTKNEHFWEALETFIIMKQDSQVMHDSITLVNVVSACGHLELVSEGKKLHGLALKTSAGMDVRVQNALITMYGRFGNSQSARLVFDYCKNHNLCSWNCMISAYSQNKNTREAIDLFCGVDLEPNEITIATILSACTQIGVLRQGRQIHAYVCRFGFERNPYISAALVDMYSNCGRLDVAIQVFQNLPEKSVAAWNSMISAHGFHSNGEKAIQIFQEMVVLGIHPTKSTFINLLSACSHSGLVSEGLWYYEHMLEEFGVEPVTEHRVCIVDMLGRSGNLKKAYDFIMEMQTQPEPGVWGALLSACNYHGDSQMGRKVADILFALEPKNVGYYVSLANMFVAAGSWSNAVELREIVQNKQLKKTVGYSLIDVGV